MTTYERIAGFDVERLIPRDDDPPAEPGFVLMYVRPVEFINGVQLRTMLRFPSGTVVMIL